MARTAGVLESFTTWATDLMETIGAPGAGLAIALENLFPPLPSEVILPLAGFTASQGKMSLLGAILWTTAGSVIGAIVLYYVGFLFGRERLIAIAGKMPLIKISDIEKTEAWFAKHGVKAVFFGRMIPIFRSLISIPAGVERMKLTTFLAFTTLGSLIWNTLFIFAGYKLGSHYKVIAEYVDIYSNVIVVVVLVALVVFVAFRIRANMKAKKNPPDDTIPGGASSEGDGIYRSGR